MNLEVEGGPRLVANVADKLLTVLAGIKETAAALNQIDRASQEQAGAIREVSTAVRQMDETTQQNAALVEEMNAAIEQNEGQANHLDELVGVFVNEAESGTGTGQGPGLRKLPTLTERCRPN